MIKINNSMLPISEPNIPGWFSVQELSLCYEAILYSQPMTCLEIGTYMGRSAYAICSALKTLGGPRKLICVDTFASPRNDETFALPFMKTLIGRYPEVKDQYFDYVKYPTTLDCFKLTLNRYSFMKDYVDVVKCNSTNLNLSNVYVDFALIDGDHTYQGVKNDFLKILPLLQNGSVVTFHDNSVHFPDIQAFIVEEVQKAKGITPIGQVHTAITFQIDDKETLTVTMSNNN